MSHRMLDTVAELTVERDTLQATLLIVQQDLATMIERYVVLAADYNEFRNQHLCCSEYVERVLTEKYPKLMEIWSLPDVESTSNITAALANPQEL